MSTEGQRAAEILVQARRLLGTSARWRSGVAASYTDGDGYVEVLVDAVDATTGTDDDEPDDGDDPNPPCYARVLGAPVALDQRVTTIATPDGALYVIAFQPHTIGFAAIEGGVADVPVASTAAVAIDLLRAEYTVAHPNHLIRFDINVQLQSGGAANTLVGRIRREDPDATTVEVGRFLRSTDLASGATIMAGVPTYDVAPDPGEYTAWPSVQASVGGWSILLDPSTTPLWAASLEVVDCGPLPAAVALTRA